MPSRAREGFSLTPVQRSGVFRTGPWLRPRRPIAGALVAGLLVSLSPAVPATAAPAGPPPAKIARSAPSEAADVPSARVAARLSGKRVEALSERAETSTTWVNPDGTLTAELNAGPVRFRRGNAWFGIDETLTRSADGTIRPKSHPPGWCSLAAPAARQWRPARPPTWYR